MMGYFMYDFDLTILKFSKLFSEFHMNRLFFQPPRDNSHIFVTVTVTLTWREMMINWF